MLDKFVNLRQRFFNHFEIYLHFSWRNPDRLTNLIRALPIKFLHNAQ